MLSGIQTQPLLALDRDGLLAEIGQDHVFDDIDGALAAARVIVGAPAVPLPGEAQGAESSLTRPADR